MRVAYSCEAYRLHRRLRVALRNDRHGMETRCETLAHEIRKSGTAIAEWGMTPG